MITANTTYTRSAGTSGSRPTTHRSATHGRTSTRDISYGDRIYASLVLGGRVVAEFTRECVGTYSDLLFMLRAMTPSCRGLARLTVRNMSRGWSLQRPMMLYAEPGYQQPRRLMPWDTH